MENNGQLKIGVIGLGPVGCIIMSHLQKADAFVVGCDIDIKRIEKIKKKGLVLKHAIDDHVDGFELCHSVQELEMYDLDLIVVSVKTPALRNVLQKLVDIKNDKMLIMCAQNGIDNEQIAASFFGEERTLRMVINFAGNMSSRNTVHVSFFNPPNYVAALRPFGEEMAEKYANLLNSVNLETVIPEDIQDYVWEKAILNAALSAVCAITRRTMKDVMDFKKTLELVEALIDESVRVADREGIELGKKFRRFCIRYLKNAGHHRPSMLTDIENGRRTEIDQLNGKIVEYGHKHYLPTPLNQSVTALVHLLEYSPE